MEQYLFIKPVIILFVALHLKVAYAVNTASPKLVSYSIPEKRLLKKALGYEPDTYLNFKELTSKYNYQCEEHTVITDDGYILTVFRLLPKCSEPKRQYPVLLMHGVMDSSDAWVLAGPKIGIGFVLARNCYDVWVANHRGNSYSRRHVSLDPNADPEYWNYTFDEHGNYDVPATVDYILRSTEQSKLNYIGHSQGTTDFFVMNSLKPKYNDKINLSIQLAPVAWLKNLENPASVIAAQNSALIKVVLDELGFRELFAKDHIVHFVTEILCQMAPDSICGEGLALTVGYKQGTISSRTLSIAFGHVLNGMSSKGAVHFGQLVVSGNFQRYNEGTKGNIKRYGTPKPPKYNVSMITAPVVLFSAKSDWLCSLKDVEILSSKLPNLLENYLVPDPHWSHHNYLWGTKAPVYVFPKILDYLNRFN